MLEHKPGARWTGFRGMLWPGLVATQQRKLAALRTVETPLIYYDRRQLDLFRDYSAT